MSYYTEEALQRLMAKLIKLKQERHQVAEQLRSASAMGDLKENAEYHAAKAAQGSLEAKIASLEQELAAAKPLDMQRMDASRISILSKVTVRNQHNGHEATYSIVPSIEADPKQGKISVTSPVARGLLGKQTGQTATIQLPKGELILEVLSISR